LLLLLLSHLPPRPPLFPYTTLFRSHGGSPIQPQSAAGSRGSTLGGDVWRLQGTDLPFAGSIPLPSQAFETHASAVCFVIFPPRPDRKSTRLNSSHQIISYAVFCLQK